MLSNGASWFGIPPNRRPRAPPPLSLMWAKAVKRGALEGSVAGNVAGNVAVYPAAKEKEGNREERPLLHRDRCKQHQSSTNPPPCGACRGARVAMETEGALRSAEMLAALAEARRGPECEHGAKGGASLHPETGLPICPICRFRSPQPHKAGSVVPGSRAMEVWGAGTQAQTPPSQGRYRLLPLAAAHECDPGGR